MNQRTVVHIPEEISNKYRFVVVAGKRCEQLQRGAFPKVEVVVPMSRQGQAQDAPRLASFWSTVAVEEVEQDKIGFENPEVTIYDYSHEELPFSGE